jgi:hypothetical protein
VASGLGLSFTSSSLALTVATRTMLHRLGAVPGLSISRPNGASGHVINGRRVGRSGPLYIIRLAGEAAAELGRRWGVDDPRLGCTVPRLYDRVVDGFVWRRVARVALRDYAGPVHNFEVADDHSYQTISCLVHNCDAFSQAMHRFGVSGAGAVGFSYLGANGGTKGHGAPGVDAFGNDLPRGGGSRWPAGGGRR